MRRIEECVEHLMRFGAEWRPFRRRIVTGEEAEAGGQSSRRVDLALVEEERRFRSAGLFVLPFPAKGLLSLSFCIKFLEMTSPEPVEVPRGTSSTLLYEHLVPSNAPNRR